MRLQFLGALCLFAFGFLNASPASARSVEVTSGEHDGFTRVVLNFGQALDWKFGRILDGYRFRPVDQTADYALDPVFEKIGKSRLAAISENLETSELDIGFACACHAIAFEFRPGIIVIDLRDGPPPNGSSFENALPELNISPAPPQTPQPAEGSSQVQPLAYNWLNRFSPAAVQSATMATEIASPSLAPPPSSIPDLQPLRDQLLRQLSRGASEGVIELALPEPPSPVPPKADVDAARVALGELGSVTVQTARTPDQPIGAEGTLCISPEKLSFADWAKDWDGLSSATEILAQDMNKLVGEFDLPDPDSVSRAVKARLFMGFGVEARQILTSFPIESEDQAVWTGLSYLLDGEEDPSSPFLGQAQCATPAAMWAVLADSSLTSATQINTDAVVLAFSRLPPHLRKLVGPRLIERFVSMQDDAAARNLRDAVLRASGQMPADLSVAEARIALAQGDPSKAEAHLEGAVTGVSFSSAQALISLVDARIAQDLPVEVQTVGSLSAMLDEMRGTEIEPEIRSALIRAEAAAGNFETAFAKLVDSPTQAPKVWRALAKLGPDSTLLEYTVPTPNPFPNNLDTVTVNGIAERLLGLGLPKSALEWIENSSEPDQLRAAQAHLALRDGQSALAILEQMTTEPALILKAQAQRLLGDAAAAAETLAQAGQESARLSALAQAKDWASLAQEPASNWAALAADLDQNAVELSQNIGPLASGQALAQQSAKTRAEIEKLLTGLSGSQPTQE
jgi:hypothetical protein